MMLIHSYQHIISLENLLLAWQEFAKGKGNRKDVQEFGSHLMDNIINLHRDLTNKTYRHYSYEAFNISDPKPRRIHKAIVRDRLLHHAIHRRLYPFFDQKFVAHSYSCRTNKGTHRALDSFNTMARKVSVNHTKTCWVLKCDIRRFFDSVDHKILLRILEKHIVDEDVPGLLSEIIMSFNTKPGKGLPLGNLTSQLLVNVYMNEFDQWIKHSLKAKYYIRYADDFVILNQDRKQLTKILSCMIRFLDSKLALEMHPKKVSISTFASGIDFLGWIHFPTHRVLRTVTKRRVIKNVQGQLPDSLTVRSYLGLLGHGDAYKISRQFEM
jgi:retron-type reverse transcriptase